jgi:hypothetical protein
MAYPTGINFQLEGAVAGLRPIAETTTTQHHAIGTQALAKDFNYGAAKFLYLAGVASTVPGDFVCYNLKTGATVRAVHGGATSTGPGAVAMSANIDGQWGWYCVFGAVPVAAATVAADLPLYLTATAGALDDAVVTGDKISGAISRAATVAGFATCQLAYPEISADDDVSSAATLRTDLDATVIVANAAATKASILKITLTAEAENGGANTIEVEGQVEDMAGLDAATAREVLVRSLAVTANEGDLSIGAGANPGTLIKAVNPATGENVAWITTTTAGHFRFIVTNTAAETNLVQVSANGAVTAVLKLTFA